MEADLVLPALFILFLNVAFCVSTSSEMLQRNDWLPQFLGLPPVDEDGCSGPGIRKENEEHRKATYCHMARVFKGSKGCTDTEILFYLLILHAGCLQYVEMSS